VSKEYAVPIDSVIIEDLKISPGSKKGDGYSCLISALDFVATIDNVKHEKHYIAKYANDDGRKAMLNMVYLHYFSFLFASLLHPQQYVNPKTTKTWNILLPSHRSYMAYLKGKHYPSSNISNLEYFSPFPPQLHGLLIGGHNPSSNISKALSALVKNKPRRQLAQPLDNFFIFTVRLAKSII